MDLLDCVCCLVAAATAVAVFGMFCYESACCKLLADATSAEHSNVRVSADFVVASAASTVYGRGRCREVTGVAWCSLVWPGRQLMNVRDPSV